MFLLSACSVGLVAQPDAAGSGDGATPSDAGRAVDANRVVPDSGFIACEVTSAHADPLPSTLLFQVDTSGSMNCRADAPSCAVGDWTPAPDDSRYDVFLNVLRGALAGLPDATQVGAMHYPVTFSCARDELLVDIDALSTTRAALDTELGQIRPEGITPTRDAVTYALARLRARSSDESRNLVLATDGAATVCLGCDADCSLSALDRDNQALIEDVRTAAASGIRTYVIGVPGSASYRGILSRMASAAGTARSGCSDAGPTYCHYDLTDPSLDFAVALRDALADIGEAVLSCEYPIPPNPDETFDPTKVNVRLVDETGAEETIPRDRDHADGWDYSEDGERILLHGAACERAQALDDGRIDVLFGCPTILI